MTGDWTAWPGERFSPGEGLRLAGERLVAAASTVGLLALPADGEPEVPLQLARDRLVVTTATVGPAESGEFEGAVLSVPLSPQH